MPWNNKSMLTDKDGNFIPQIWDPSINDFIPWDGKVQLSGTIVEQGEVARDVIVTPGSEVIAYTDSNKLAAVALSAVVNAKAFHNFSFRVIERPVSSVPGYPSIYFETKLQAEGKSTITMLKKPLSANWQIQYRIMNSSDIDQSYAIARGLWYV